MLAYAANRPDPAGRRSISQCDAVHRRRAYRRDCALDEREDGSRAAHHRSADHGRLPKFPRRRRRIRSSMTSRPRRRPHRLDQPDPTPHRCDRSRFASRTRSTSAPSTTGDRRPSGRRRRPIPLPPQPIPLPLPVPPIADRRSSRAASRAASRPIPAIEAAERGSKLTFAWLSIDADGRVTGGRADRPRRPGLPRRRPPPHDRALALPPGTVDGRAISTSRDHAELPARRLSRGRGLAAGGAAPYLSPPCPVFPRPVEPARGIPRPCRLHAPAQPRAGHRRGAGASW